MRDYDTLGSKLGPKIAKLVSDAIVATKRQLGPHEVQVRSQATWRNIDRAGHEIADLYRPIVEKIIEHGGDDIHPLLQDFFTEAASGQHQAKAIAGLAMGSVQGALGAAISNAVAPFVYLINEHGPNLSLDQNTAASAAANGIVAYGEAQHTAAQQGYAGEIFQTLFELAQQVPTLTELYDLLNRGQMSEGEAHTWARRNGIPENVIERLLSLRINVLPPDLAALAVLRGVIPLSEGERLAARAGISADDFAIMIADTGEPPGLEQLNEAYRRHIIDKRTLEKGIKESRVRDEWIPVVEALRYVPMSVADAVNAVVQNHISTQLAAEIADENGLRPGDVDTLIQTAGEPLSRTEMEQLYNRGLVTRAQVNQALRESRLKDKYIDDAFELHRRLIEPRILSSAVEFGAVSHADAVKRAMEWGYTAEDAVILVDEGSRRKLQTYRNRIISAAEQLFEENALSAVQLKDTVKAQGYDEAEADLVVQAADYRRKEKAVTLAITAIRSKYIARHIDRNRASGLLDKAGVIADRRDFLLNMWDVEQSANVRVLTEAQLIRALKKQTLSAQQVADRLITMGYSQVDTALLIADA
jgi:hypothetical protein